MDLETLSSGAQIGSLQERGNKRLGTQDEEENAMGQAVESVSVTCV